jgi:hypothetical protein
MPEHYDFREAREEIEIQNEQVKRWNDPARASSELMNIRATPFDLFKNDDKISRLDREKLSEKDQLGVSTHTVMRKRSDFTVEQSYH